MECLHQRSGVQTPTTPELTSSETTSMIPVTRTNTLVITSLPPSFFAPAVLEALRTHFESYGEVHTWAPIRAFARIILIYYDEEAAELAKEDCDSILVGETDASPSVLLRVFRADPTPLEQLSNPDLLRPPALEKNFLISPPGSPPVGWEQIREEPPNNTPLADDLIAALKRLQFERESHGTSGVAVLVEPEEGVGISICVEDCGDGDGEPEAQDEGSWACGLHTPMKTIKPMPTAMPPMPIRV